MGHGVSSNKQSWKKHNIKPHHWVKEVKKEGLRDKEMGLGAGQETNTSLSCYSGHGESLRAFVGALTSS